MPEWIAQVWTLHLAPEAAVGRLGAAVGLGALIGVEREAKGRAAGLRTHMIVALASALFTILAFEMFQRLQEMDSEVNADPLRLFEAITAGVAFLAAGSIIRRNGGVQGLTTGAGLWLAGAVGMAAGLGFFALAALATALALAILTMIRWIEPTSSKDEKS